MTDKAIMTFSIIIPVLHEGEGLLSLIDDLHTLRPEIPHEIIVVDGGPGSDTLEALGERKDIIALVSPPGRARQMNKGAGMARGKVLLFLHADTVLSDGWVREVHTLIDRIGTGDKPDTAAAFRFALDDEGIKPRLLEAAVAFRCAVFKLPYGDQGLLISRRRYDALGGFKPLKIMEDVDLVRRIPRRERLMLRTKAMTSAARYRRDGYLKRPLRNLTCLTLYTLRAPSTWIERLYGQ